MAGRPLQLRFAFSPARPSRDALAERLARTLGERVTVQVTDNRSTMVSFRRRPGVVSFRLHHMFADAPEDVLHALARFASRGRGRRAAGRVLDDYIRANGERIRRGAGRARPLEARGRVHDLRAIFEALNARYFQGRLDARIGWGRASSRRRRTIKMGTYFHETRTIHIHRALDQERVPEYFVAWVVYHEMLHQQFPPERHGSRRRVHPPAFWERERAFHDVERARAWERAHLGLLLSGRR